MERLLDLHNFLINMFEELQKSCLIAAFNGVGKIERQSETQLKVQKVLARCPVLFSSGHLVVQLNGAHTNGRLFRHVLGFVVDHNSESGQQAVVKYHLLGYLALEVKDPVWLLLGQQTFEAFKEGFRGLV